MNQIQVVLTVGMPTLAVLVGILLNNRQLDAMRAEIDRRFTRIETRLDAIETSLRDVRERLVKVETKLEGPHLLTR